MRKAVLYARVSSKEQEREGFSIPAQLKLLREYARSKSFAIAAEFTDVETAGKSGRENFTAMIQTLKPQPDRLILVEKTDRLYRNFKDYVTLEDLEVEVHLVKEGSILSKDSRCNDKFIHGINVLMAKRFLDNLRDETEKGMREKAEQGVFPSGPPRGYRNAPTANGKRGIIVDPARSREVIDLFERYATGKYSLKSLPHPRWAYPQLLKKMFDNPFYFGEFNWKGVRYKGSHDPIVSRQLWEQCQGIMQAHSRRTRTPNRTFPFSGLIHCGWCSGMMIGRLHKQRYIYYHCRNPLTVCGEPYIRQEDIETQYVAAVNQLQITESVVERIKAALRKSASHAETYQREATDTLRREYDRLQKRLESAYIDKLDGRIATEMFMQLSSEWRERQDAITAELLTVEQAGRTYVDEGVAILDLCQKAPRLFAVQSAIKKRRLLDVLCLNSTWKAQVLQIQWRKPFDSLVSVSESEKASPRGQWLNSLVSTLVQPDAETKATYELMQAA